MYVLSRIIPDKAGRINVAKVIGNNPSEKIGIAYNDETKELVVEPYREESGFICRNIDRKNRIYLPSWLRDYVKDHGLYLVVEDKKRKLKIIDPL